MKKNLAGFAVALLSMAAGAAHAVEVRPLIGFGLTFGGDKLGSATYNNGDTVDISSGGLIAFNAGLELQFTPEVSGQLVLGYHVDRANAQNGSMRFERTPVELLGHYRINDSWRLGGGLRYINEAKVRASGAGLSFASNQNFKPSTGFVIEGEYLPTQSRIGFKVRVVSETFKSKDFRSAPDVDGTHVGGFMTYYFK